MPEDVSRRGEVTRLLAAVERGDAASIDALFPIVYDELRALAAAQMAREPAGHTLQPTALVHEAYLRLIGSNAADPERFRDRAYFFAAASEAMRRILVERARRYRRIKRGSNPERVPLDEVEPRTPVASWERVEEVLAVDEALAQLETRDRTMAEIAKLRFFAGMSVEETAAALASSVRTVERQWTAARAFLLSRLGPAGG